METNSDSESKSSELYIVYDGLSASESESESEELKSEYTLKYEEEMSRWEIEDAFLNNTIDDMLDELSYIKYAFLMHYAFEYGRDDLIEYIYTLQHNNNDISVILEHAVENNYKQVVEYILTKTDAFELLSKYVFKNNLKMIKTILLNNTLDIGYILEESIMQNNIHMIRYIIRYVNHDLLPSQQEIATLLCYYGDITSIRILVPKVVNDRELIQMIYDSHESERIRTYLKLLLKFKPLHLYYKL